MEKIIVGIREKVNYGSMAKFLTLTGMLIALPGLIHIQWVTGPLVNALLILLLILVGKRAALLACFIPSMIALAVGFLPAVIAPMLPFIMLSNVLFVLIIDWIYYRALEQDRGYWLGVAAGAVAKFTWLFLTFSLVSHLVINKKIITIAVQMMSWTQLATALTGGLIAWMILKWLNNYGRKF